MRRGGVTTRTEDGVKLVHIVGELDAAAVPIFFRALPDSDHHPVVVDLHDCDFIDSSGLAAIIEAWRSAKDPDRKQPFVVASPTRSVKRLFREAGIEGHIDIYRSVKAAVAAVKPH